VSFEKGGHGFRKKKYNGCCRARKSQGINPREAALKPKGRKTKVKCRSRPTTRHRRCALLPTGEGCKTIFHKQEFRGLGKVAEGVVNIKTRFTSLSELRSGMASFLKGTECVGFRRAVNWGKCRYRWGAAFGKGKRQASDRGE